MNLTLSIDPDLLKEARKTAIEMDTTVNSLVRNYLSELVEQSRKKKEPFLKEWLRLMEQNTLDMRDRTWNRDEIHER